MTKEKLAEKIFKECLADGEPVTEEEALEMAEMELKAKGGHYTESAEPRKKAARKPKKDLDKITLVQDITQAVSMLGLEDLQVINEQRELSFRYKGEEYSLTLVKHRKPKA